MTPICPRLAVAAIAGAALVPLPASAQTTDPAAIDRAVAGFTGAPIGAPGGARRAADPRLRLARCDEPLALSWHGQARAMVRVACEAARGWQIFVPVKPPAPLAAVPGGGHGPRREEPVRIRRGDALTVIVRGHGFSVQQAGEAGENGEVGEWIEVVTARGREPVRARIERPGLAIIELR